MSSAIPGGTPEQDRVHKALCDISTDTLRRAQAQGAHFRTFPPTTPPRPRSVLPRSQLHERVALRTFLGLPYEDEMFRFHESRERTEPGLDAKRAWQPVTSGLGEGRSQMPAGDVERFETALGELLDELGYARTVPRPSLEALKHGRKIRHFFREDLRDRGDRLLERWRV